MWQSVISPVSYLINIGSGAVQAPYHELSYIPYDVDYFNIEPNASSPLLRCRDPHALRAVLAWATYILQNVFFELPFFAFTWS